MSSLNAEKFLIFTILGKLYSLESKYIGEIASVNSVYPLPLMPPFFTGIIDRYSIPYALFDLSLLYQHNESIKFGKVLVLKDEIDRVAFHIDDIEGIEDIPRNNIIKNDKGGEPNELKEAVYAYFNWNDRDVFILDIQKILSKAENIINNIY